MRRLTSCPLAVLLLAVFPGNGPGQEVQAPTAPHAAMKKVDFLAGRWKGESWTEFVPGQRSVSLSMPDYQWISDEIFTVSEFLNPAECESYIASSEATGYGEAPISTSFGPVMMVDVRNNSRVMVGDPGLAQLIWE